MLNVHAGMAFACRLEALKARAEKAESYGQKMHRLLQAMRAHLEAAQKQQEAAQQQAQSQQRQDEQQNSTCSSKAELAEAKQAIAAASIQAQSSQVFIRPNTCMLTLGLRRHWSFVVHRTPCELPVQRHVATLEVSGCRKELLMQRGNVSDCKMHSPMSKRSATWPGNERLNLKGALRCDNSPCLLFTRPNPF